MLNLEHCLPLCFIFLILVCDMCTRSINILIFIMSFMTFYLVFINIFALMSILSHLVFNLLSLAALTLVTLENCNLFIALMFSFSESVLVSFFAKNELAVYALRCYYVIDNSSFLFQLFLQIEIVLQFFHVFSLQLLEFSFLRLLYTPLTSCL